jgi:arginyl-tRNA synthetase
MTTYKTFNYKTLAPEATATIPEATLDTSALSVDQLDARIWPTPYLASRCKSEIAAGLVQSIGTILTVNLEKDALFEMVEKTKKGGEYGQYCLPVPQLRLAGNPMEMATKLSNAFNQVHKEIHITSSASGPFINFHIDHAIILKDSLFEALSYDSVFGFVNLGHHKRIGIDYSHPNIAKPFHAGHLRSTIIGNFVKMVYAANGFDVIGINYLGDWGKQYGLLAVGFEKYGEEEKLREDPIRKGTG